MKNLGARLQDSVKGAHLGERAKNALQSIEKGVTNALAERTGELDEAVKAEHSQLSALKQSFNELSVTVKKDAERAGKSSKTHQELQQQLSGLVDLEPTLRESAAPALTTSAALGRCWAEYSEAVGVSLVDPAKQELSLLFAEGSTLYGSYARLCNEIALKSRREKGGVSAELAELQGKKAAQEGEVGARLRALRAAALEVIAYFVERYDTHQASFAGELLRNTRGAGIVAPEELAAWREESMRGWYALAGKHQAERAAADQSSAMMSPRGGRGSVQPVGPPGVFGAPLEAAAARPDAVPLDGAAVPLVAYALIERLRTGRDSANNPMLGAEGLFRLSAEADDVESLVRQLGAPDARGAAAACSNPHVLAACLKRYLRKLPQPLIPAAVYGPLVEVGATLPPSGDPPAASVEALAGLLRGVPQPNYALLRLLVLFLAEVSKWAESNLMHAANLALVFVPNILRGGGGAGEFTEMTPLAAAFTAIIKHRKECLPEAASRGDSLTEVAPPPPGPPPSAPPPVPQWYYSEAGAQKGPVDAAEGARLLRDGTLTEDSYVYEEGMGDWTELRAVLSRLP